MKYHFIGIGGIGMSGLARILLKNQASVSGSDLYTSKVIDALTQLGASITIGQSAKNIIPGVTVVYSTDIKKDNPEYQAAMQFQCPLLHRSELLQLLMKDTCALTVAGTHGKTTTSSLLAWVLECSGLSPSYAIGGIIPQLASNAGCGEGKYFIAEACESDGSFINYHPYGSIVTNIDFDHMDHYKTKEALIDSFSLFMSQVLSKDHLFWCSDDPFLKCLNPSGHSYGFKEKCSLQGSHFKQAGWSISFDIEFEKKSYKDVSLPLTGMHNALNALAVFGLAIKIGIDEDSIRAAFKSFQGVLRRCEKKGEKYGILFLDDYGHHPTELKATLKAIRQAVKERRMVVVYQPHRYSRAKECMGQYGGVFHEADALFVTEIYAAREKPLPGVTHEKIIEEIQKDLKQRCQFAPRDQIASTLQSFLRPHDVVVTLGAGDVTQVSDETLKVLNNQPPQKLKIGVLFGGISVEHEISLLSAAHILDSLNTEYYDIEEFGISRQNEWLKGPNAREKLKKQQFSGEEKFSFEILKHLLDCDVLFPVLHGTLGEDGTIQGFFETFNKAYVGCDYRSAAICMDKVATKKIAAYEGIATAPFVSFSKYEWDNKTMDIKKHIKENLCFPVYVKPIHLGSSVGVLKACNEEEMIHAIENAFRFDTDILIEKEILGREIEFSIIGNEEVTAFPPGEILRPAGQSYDYESKYGKNSVGVTATTSLPRQQVEEGCALVKKAYEVMGCRGMARIDTFLDNEGKFWLNEINPIPGFTKNSLYPQMCTHNGLESSHLVDKLIILALQRRRQLNRLEVTPHE